MHTTTLIDPERLEQITLLCGTPRLFHKHSIHRTERTTWACVRINDYFFAIPLKLRADASIGPLAERILLLIHTKVRSEMKRNVVISYDEFRNWIWAGNAPKNWMSRLNTILTSLRNLRLGRKVYKEDADNFAESSLLFKGIRRHHKRRDFEFVVAEGFLGSLEDCCVQDDAGVSYDFHDKRKLRSLRNTERVIDVYLPSYLGDRDSCKLLSWRQKFLLQYIIRELTFPPRFQRNGRSVEDGIVIEEGTVPSFNGKRKVVVPFLERGLRYVSFNGNGVRQGQGYLLATWKRKAGYDEAETCDFLEDLEALCRLTGLTVVAIDKNDAWCSFNRIKTMCRDTRRRFLVSKLHLRIYAPDNFITVWNQFFGWNKFLSRDSTTGNSNTLAALNAVDDLREFMAMNYLKQSEVAHDLGITRQYISKILLTGRCSNLMQQKINDLIEASKEGTRGDSAGIVPPDFTIAKPAWKSHGDAALFYYDQGWSVVPMKPGTKQPLIRWSEYRLERPERKVVIRWWDRWQDAGVAVVLGPVSGLLAIDVDGEEAHGKLIELVGKIPWAPVVKSGSPDRFRYHVYFRHPEQVCTKSTQSPFNAQGDRQKLELRGQGGLLVLPPSRHPSGGEYGWVLGRTLQDIRLSDLPRPLLNGLRGPKAIRQPKTSNSGSENLELFEQTVLPPDTVSFLRGDHADSDGSWNSRLFLAACNLKACQIDFNQAEQWLLEGARPRTAADLQIAKRTIQSAFSMPRTMGSATVTGR